MPRKRYTAEQIITKLRQAEVEIARDQPIAEVCRKLGTSEQTYYRWRKEYGGLRVSHLKRLKALEEELGLPSAGPCGERLLPVQVDHWRESSSCAVPWGRRLRPSSHVTSSIR